MPWNDNSNPPEGGGGQGKGPWGREPPRQPWGQQRRPPGGGGPQQGGPDLEDMMRRFQERFRGRFGGRGGGGGDDGRGPGSGGLMAIGGLLLVGWFASGVYIVDQGEVGVVQRFGAFDRVTGPGLHVHFPAPIESVRTISQTEQRRIEVGIDGQQDIEGESLMLTGDESIVDIDFAVLYRLSDATEYIFNVRDQQEAIRGVAEASMREVIGTRELELVITRDRGAIELAVRDLMQSVLDEYEIGVQVLQVQMLKVAPPPQVIDAFDDVVRAGQDAETEINRAQQYLNQVVPQARGQAEQIRQQAEAYSEQVVREASGEALRFNALEAEYRRSPRVTRDRIYLETMERVYENADRIIVDSKSGAVPVIPLDTLRGTTRTPAPPAAPAPSGARGGNR
ncbi:MAG: FtsH protease activity modulator HflK [Alphaproteobacteria bacterium]|nr:FtsH protease activity modulator HflK [Alphaproteobacteria bacterium]